ncbi:hypothetical protein GEMRC1_011001 [Eukaryota sp. GEM-RC1]
MVALYPHTVAIRHETLDNYERRVPLIPDDVRILVDKGITVKVEKSGIRIFPDAQYERAGAILVEQNDIEDCDVVIGVKEVPLERLFPNKTYVYFAHVIKAQPANMPALDHLLANNIRLIDYERICDENGKRLIKFGKYAGIAGSIDTVSGLGKRLLVKEGVATPFLNLSFTSSYPSLVEAYAALDHIGKSIEVDGFVESICPVVFSICGTGAVSSGVQEVLEHFPHEYVSVDQLPALENDFSSNKIYIVQTGRNEMYANKTTKKRVNAEEYENDPSQCYSTFAEEILPYVTCIFNGVYWTAKYPRILTTAEARAQAAKGPLKLRALGDITADEGGSFEFMSMITDFDEPFACWDPASNSITDGPLGNGVMFYSVDHTPCECAVESSVQFSNKNVKYAEALAKGEILPELERGIITDKGELTPRFKYIEALRKERESERYNVLVFGAGRVSSPCVEHLLKRNDVHVTIVDSSPENVREISSKYSRCTGLSLDLSDVRMSKKLIESANVVVSLLPPFLHVPLAKMCLEMNTPFVSSSYVSDEMKALEPEILKKNLVMVNESGLDPGIDIATLSAFIDEAKSKGGKIRSVISFCGGLISPESTVGAPLAYKFSWSPAGVFRASTAPCTFIEDGEVKTCEDSMSLSKPYNFGLPLNLVGYPNRDSVIFAEKHGVRDTVDTFIRGTFRFDPFCTVVQSFKKIGLLSQEECPHLKSVSRLTWNEFVTALSKDKTEQVLEDFPGAHSIFEELGLLSNEFVPEGTVPMNVLAEYLGEKYQVGEDDADLIVMYHEVKVEYEDRFETTEMQFVRRGTSKFTAMSETVGLTVAISVLGIKDNLIKRRGLVDPTDESLYKLIVQELLEHAGITMIEKTVVETK